MIKTAGLLSLQSARLYTIARYLKCNVKFHYTIEESLIVDTRPIRSYRDFRRRPTCSSSQPHRLFLSLTIGLASITRQPTPVQSPTTTTHDMAFYSDTAKPSPGRFAKQNFDYFLVLDFEATCEDGKEIYPQEIIELPVIKVNAKTFETEAEFHTYVQPTFNTQLSEFCTQLTGITQSMVDGQPNFQESLKMLNDWMIQEDLLSGRKSFIFVTCGDWDLRKQLTHQCDYTKTEFPHYCKQWVNIKKAFAAATGKYCKGLPALLSHFNLSFQGRHHSGIDDSRNIAIILKEIARKGFVFNKTGYLP